MCWMNMCVVAGICCHIAVFFGFFVFVIVSVLLAVQNVETIFLKKGQIN